MASAQRAPEAEHVEVEHVAAVERRGEGGGDERLDVAPGRGGVGVLRGDDLALLGDAQRPVDAAAGLGEDGLVGGPPPRPTVPPLPWKSRRRAPAAGRRSTSLDLCLVERPVRGQVAAVLVRVRVADHHLLPVTAGGDHRAVDRQGQQRGQRGVGLVQVVDRLEERDDVERGRGHVARVSSPASFSSTATSSTSLTDSAFEIT